MDFSVERSGGVGAGGVGVLRVEGDMTIQHIAELKAALMKYLETVDHLILNLDSVTEIDLSCLQLLCSAHRTSSRLKKQLTITGSRMEGLRQIIEASGYSRHIGCNFDCNKNCLWIGGATDGQDNNYC